MTYVTTTDGFRAALTKEAQQKRQPPPGYWVVPEANRKQKLKLVGQLLKLVFIILTIRPDVIVTTGASVGYFAIRLGKLCGARCVWVDSIANAEEMSLSGRMIGPHADLWLTQWEELSTPDGPEYRGAVL